MALQKQTAKISFAQGLDTKTDPWQVLADKFLALSNLIFKGGLLAKRNGFAELPSVLNSPSALTTYAGNLAAIGTSLQIFSDDTETWLNRGTIQPASLSVVPAVRTSISKSSCDSAVAPNGLACVAFTDATNVSYYQIIDSITGQIIVSQTAIPSGGLYARVFVLGQYFIITFITSNPYLQYIAIPLGNPTNPAAAVSFATNVVLLFGNGYDGIVYQNNLYLGWSISGKISVNILDSSLNKYTAVTVNSSTASAMSLAVDSSQSPIQIWSTWIDEDGDLQSAAWTSSNQTLTALLAPTDLVLAATTATNIASRATGGTVTVFYEIGSTYGFSGTLSNYINTTSCTSAGVTGTPSVVLRGVGLASKAFYLASNSTTYFLVAYAGAFQPTYFLSDSNGNLVAKLAYSNGGGYCVSLVLPSVTLAGNVANISYLIKDAIQPVNANQGVVSAGAIYAQTGINLASFTLNQNQTVTQEIANNLHLTGGFLWMYDGSKPVEHQFHVWPEDIVVSTGTVSKTPTGRLVSGSNFITSISSMTGIQVGCAISGTAIPVGATVTSVSIAGSALTISAPATGSHSGETITITGNVPEQQYYYYALYKWTDAQGNIHRSAPSIPYGVNVTGSNVSTNTINIPTLRLTAKQSLALSPGSSTVPTAVQIELYRWSAAQQIPYLLTSITSPLLNDPTVDYVTYTDVFADAGILGNLILYTEGGVVDDVAAPACNVATLYKSRLMVLDAEDPNTIWYSKQVIEGTPVEMSDLFTLYIAPTISAQGSTGPATALSAMDDKLIVFKKNAIYYMTGDGPDNTGANSDFSNFIFITSTVGCANPQSIVFIPNGLMFQSDKGIWLLGRDLSTNYIGAPVEAFNGQTVLSAITIPGTNQVRFTLSGGVTLIYDYYYNQWGTFSNVPAISSVVYNGLHTYLNALGGVYQENPGSYLDGASPVLISLTTAWLQLAGLRGYQRAYYFFLLGQYLSPHKLNVQISGDYNSNPNQTFVISPTNFAAAFGEIQTFGGASPFGGGTQVEQWRVNMLKQKCQAFQVTITESYDPSFGVSAGAGLTLSGMNVVCGIKGGYPKIAPTLSTG